jgi:uncharacterized protein (TIGR03067 family)
MNLLAVCVLGSLVLADDAGKERKGLAELQGTWALVRLEANGKDLPAEKVKGGKLTVKGDRYTFEMGEVKVRGTYKPDTAKKPWTIDAVRTSGKEKGRTLLGIYEIKGRELKMCLARPGGERRPSSFATKDGDGARLYVFRKAEEETGAVKGVVTSNGKPLPGGAIAFHPEKGKPVEAKIKDGAFSADKVPVGTARVSIKAKGVRVPQKYAFADKSGISVEVKKGRNDIDVDLSD